MLRFVACVPFALACAGEPDPFPAADLYGTWAETDAGTTRAWVFEAEGADPTVLGLPDVFALYSYPEGGEATVVQRGQYAVATAPLSAFADEEHTALVQTVRWSVDGSTPTVANRIYHFDGEALELDSQTAEDGRRLFLRVDALP